MEVYHSNVDDVEDDFRAESLADPSSYVRPKKSPFPVLEKSEPSMTDAPLPTAQEVFESLENPLYSRDFYALLVVCLAQALIFIANAASNAGVVDIEYQYGKGLSIYWFGVVNVILAVLTVHMVYSPYILDRQNGSNTVLVAFIIYISAQILWSTVLFHSRVNRGTAGVVCYFLLAAVLWLGWVCYQFVKSTIFIFLILLVWTFYLQMYTYDVDAHPWIPL